MFTAQKEENGVDVFDWSSQSSDANQIENVWAIVQFRLRGKESIQWSSFFDKLMWRSLSQNDTMKLVESMSN